MEKVIDAVQDFYPEEVSMCYGCGRLNDSGHHFRTGWDGDNTVTIFTPKPEHISFPGFVYGGMIASLIDCHGIGSAALFVHRKNGHELGDETEPPRFVTGTLKVDFIKPTPLGVPLKAVGTVHEIHPKKYRVETAVYANGTQVASGEVIAVSMPRSFTKND